jgi:hypothetical protein
VNQLSIGTESGLAGTGGLYRRDGSTFHPSDLTTGPWRSDAQHGGPPSGLLTALCEELLEDGEVLARIHVSLLTLIPIEPLESQVRRTRVSRRVAHIEAELHHADRKVAEARALALTGGRIPDPDWKPPPASAPSWDHVEPTTAPHWAAEPSRRVFHRDGIEHRFLEGRFDGPGPAVDWVRPREPVIAGGEPSGYERVMSVVDVGSGISAAFDPGKGFGMINADLNVAFVAEPSGPWLRLEATTFVAAEGTGLAVTKVHDAQRLVAVATQSLLGTTFEAG